MKRTSPNHALHVDTTSVAEGIPPERAVQGISPAMGTCRLETSPADGTVHHVPPVSTRQLGWQTQVMDKESLRVLLQRAEEIQSQRDVPLSWPPNDQEILNAAEEAGLDRAAVEQALREQLSLESRTLQPGGLVFAPTPDGYHRVATVLSSADDEVEVRFFGGSDLRVRRGDTRPFSILPGQRIQAPWPRWGWWTCSVVSYDRELKVASLSDGCGNVERFSIADLRADFRRPTPAAERLEALKWKLAFAFGGGIVGTAVGFLLSRLG